MTWFDALRAQTRHHHACWSECIARVSASSTQVRLDPGGPHLAWLLAHCIDEVDSTGAAVAELPRLAPPGPGPEQREVAPWQELTGQWTRCSNALLEALESMEPEELERPPAVEIHPAFVDTLRTRRQWLTGHVFHLAYHLGQAALLRAATERIGPSGQ